MTTSSRVGARLAPVVAVIVVGVAALLSLVDHSARPTSPEKADYVLIAGAPGLRWEDVSPAGTPALWRLAGQASIGALSVTSAAKLTCPLDGWLTVGAGNLADWGGPSSGDSCEPLPITVTRPDRLGGRVVEQPRVVEHNRKLAWGAQPGALAESVRCTAAVGAGAAVAAARPIGRVDRFVPVAPKDLTPLLAECVLAIVDLGMVDGTGSARAASVAKVDAMLARVLAARPANSLVIVAGLSDTEGPSRLHVVVADGPGFPAGWLGSSSTNRAGYVKLFDIAPTALAALGEPAPVRLFAGEGMSRLGGRPADVMSAVGELADADGQAHAQHRVTRGFLLAVGIAVMVVLLAAIPFLRRARDGGVRRLRPGWARARRMVEVALAASGLAIPVALAADLVPWWRSAAPGLIFVAIWLVLLAGATAVVLLPAFRARTLGTAAAAGAVAVVIVVINVLGGGWLQLDGVGGYTAADGGRYAGVGIIGLGVVVGGLFVSVGSAAQLIDRSWRVAAVAMAGCAGIALVGSPYLGADAAGAIAVTAGTCVAVVLASGGWFTAARLAIAAAAGAALIAIFAIMDLSVPPTQRGSLGQFLLSVRDGTAGLVVQRAGTANVVAVATSPLTPFAVAATAYVFFILYQHWGGLRRLFGLYPTLRAVLAGLVVSAGLGGLFNGAGFVVAGAAAAVTVPLVTLTSLRALAHADERTFAAASPRPDADTAPAGDGMAGAVLA